MFYVGLIGWLLLFAIVGTVAGYVAGKEAGKREVREAYGIIDIPLDEDEEEIDA